MLFAAAPLYAIYKDNKNKKKAAKELKAKEEAAKIEALKADANMVAQNKADVLEQVPVEERLYPGLDDVQNVPEKYDPDQFANT